MPLGLGKKPLYNAEFAVAVVTAPLCIPATILRFMASHRANGKFGREDWLALAALIVLLVYDAADLVVLNAIDGKELGINDLDTIIYIGKISYAVDPLFVINQFCAKFSLLFLFHRIFWVNKTFVRWIYAIGIVHISYSIACLCIYFFSCRPISKSWDVLQPGTCVNYNASVAGLESINSGVDLAMVILAVLMVRKLHISKSLKIKLAFLFGLGSFAGIIGFIKIGEAYSSDDDSHSIIGVWAILQMGVSIICCCAPTYRKVLPTDNFFSRIKSGVSTHGSWSKFSRTLRSKQSHSSGLSATKGRGPSVSSKDEGLLSLDASSQRGHAWTEVDAEPVPGAMEQPAFPMKTVSIQHKYNAV